MNTHLLATISRKAALKTLPIGLGLALLMGGLMAGIEVILYMTLQALPGIAFLIFFAWVLAPFFGRQIHDHKRNPLIMGFLLCLASLFLAILCSALVYSVVSLDFHRFINAFFGPLYWVFVVGTVPCIALGYIYSHFLTAELPETRQRLKPSTALVLLLIFMGVYSGIYFTYYFLNKAVPEEVVLPHGYEGTFLIVYGQETHGVKHFNGQIKSYRVGPGGILFSKFKPSEGLDPENHFYYQLNGKRQELTQKFLKKQGLKLRHLPGNYFDDNNCNFRYQAFYLGKNAKSFIETFRPGEYIRQLVNQKKIDCSLLDKLK